MISSGQNTTINMLKKSDLVINNLIKTEQLLSMIEKIHVQSHPFIRLLSQIEKNSFSDPLFTMTKILTLRTKQMPWQTLPL